MWVLTVHDMEINPRESMENPDDNPDITKARLREAQQRTMERLIRGIEELTDRIGRLEIHSSST